MTASLPPNCCASSMLINTGAYTTTWLYGLEPESCDIARFRLELELEFEAEHVVEIPLTVSIESQEELECAR